MVKRFRVLLNAFSQQSIARLFKESCDAEG
ncbi:MAG: hypothetical protein LBH06_05580, partial [Rikenellaceae bacterium]|nr:hypothetical protein [Rikenellaceae bacterium]